MFKKEDKNKIDTNFKMMSISAIVLVVLFFYVLIESDNAMQGSSYYIGIVFLFILMGLAFGLQKYKNKAEQRLKIADINPKDLINSKWEIVEYKEITADYFIEKWYRLLFMYREKNLSWIQKLRLNDQRKCPCCENFLF